MPKYFAEQKTVFIFADMKAKKNTTIERNDRIRERYEQLDKENKFKPVYIYGVIAKEFFLSPATVENIIFFRV